MLHTEDWRRADLGKMTSRAKFHYFVLLAAIEVFLTVSWLGFITVQPVSITTLHIPVLLAALFCGPWGGAAVGAVFGGISIWKASTLVFTPGDAVFSLTATTNVFGTLVMAFGARVLFGLCAGLLYEKLYWRRRPYLGLALVSFAGAALHTVFVLGAMGWFFPSMGLNALSMFSPVLRLNTIVSCGLPSVLIPALCWFAQYTAIGRRVKHIVTETEHTAFYGGNARTLLAFCVLTLFIAANLVSHFVDRILGMLRLHGLYIDEVMYQTTWVYGQQFLVGLLAVFFLMSLAVVSLYNKSNDAVRRSVLDPLTRLYHKAAIETQVEQLLQAPSAEMGTFLMIDIDHFKQINDTFGHPVGDRAICAMAESLRRFAGRANGIAGRMGGDEFCLYFRQRCSESELVSLLEGFLQEIRQLPLPSGKMTCSIGLVQQTTQQSFAELYRAADNALYVAKRDGRDTYHMYEELS